MNALNEKFWIKNLVFVMMMIASHIATTLVPQSLVLYAITFESFAMWGLLTNLALWGISSVSFTIDSRYSANIGNIALGSAILTSIIQLCAYLMANGYV
ncbi:MAG TPA: hypothetical protein DCS19_04180 [Flavobacterium sp.]|nr:hypothetical protein [Flavobacterium sp.]